MRTKWVLACVAMASAFPAAGGLRAAEAAPIVAAGNVVFPSGIYGSNPDPMQQVDEVVQKAHTELARKGLGFGNMIQHTIFLKDGAAQPIAVLQRFHAEAWRLAPSLKEKRSVGTIIRVPDFPDKNTIIMLDIVAGAPERAGQPDDFPRIPFTFGPQEIVETVAVDNLVFTAGLEAMDFQHGTLAPGIDEQIDAIVGKLDGALKKSGLTLADMISHNLYVRRGTDPMHVIDRFHELTRKLAPGLRERPSVGTLALVDGMAGDGFLLEMDAVAARPRRKGGKSGTHRVLFDDRSMPIARSVTAGDLVFLSGEDGSDPAKSGAIPSDVFEQVEVAVKKIDATLRRSGLTLDDLVKHRLFLKNGAADPGQVRRKFHEVATRLAPGFATSPSAETLLLVEGLATGDMAFEASVIAARRKK